MTETIKERFEEERKAAERAVKALCDMIKMLVEDWFAKHSDKDILWLYPAEDREDVAYSEQWEYEGYNGNYYLCVIGVTRNMDAIAFDEEDEDMPDLGDDGDAWEKFAQDGNHLWKMQNFRFTSYPTMFYDIVRAIEDEETNN